MAVPSSGYHEFMELIPPGEGRLRDRLWDVLFPSGTVTLREPTEFEFKVSFHPFAWVMFIFYLVITVFSVGSSSNARSVQFLSRFGIDRYELVSIQSSSSTPIFPR